MFHIQFRSYGLSDTGRCRRRHKGDANRLFVRVQAAATAEQTLHRIKAPFLTVTGEEV